MNKSSGLLFFIVKRLLYSMLILLGILLVTFILFRIAAGDPARTVLGKNPSPKEVEDMRIALSSGKPLFWGYWRKTEAYPSYNFAKKRNVKGISITQNIIFNQDCAQIPKSELIEFKRNFNLPNKILAQMLFQFKGKINIALIYNDKEKNVLKFSSKSWDSIVLTLNPNKNSLPSSIQCYGENVSIKNVTFFRKQNSPWDSQLLAALKELISFQDTFPYISFFNFGRTLVSRESINDILKEGIGPSLSLMIPIFFGELFLGIILAMIAVAFKDKILDKLIMLLSVAGMSISYIVFMIFGQYYLAYYYNIFPVWGFENISYLFLPVLIGIIGGIGGGIRFYRTIFINELKKEYLRTAVAKGIPAHKVFFKHLLKNTAVPIITRASSILPFLFTGSLLLESFFGIPGLGYAAVNALMNSDIQLLKALVILTAILFITANLLADIINTYIDSRIKF